MLEEAELKWDHDGKNLVKNEAFVKKQNTITEGSMPATIEPDEAWLWKQREEALDLLKKELL